MVQRPKFIKKLPTTYSRKCLLLRRWMFSLIKIQNQANFIFTVEWIDCVFLLSLTSLCTLSFKCIGYFTVSCFCASWRTSTIDWDWIVKSSSCVPNNINFVVGVGVKGTDRDAILVVLFTSFCSLLCKRSGLNVAHIRQQCKTTAELMSIVPLQP